MIVVDASFAIEASLTSGGLLRLRGKDAIAPALMWSEAASVLHEMQWRKAISPKLALAALARLSESPIRLRRPPGLLALAWEIADKRGWAKTYDAEYLALAKHSNCPLLTLDAKLAKAAQDLVPILAPGDL